MGTLAGQVDRLAGMVLVGATMGGTDVELEGVVVSAAGPGCVVDVVESGSVLSLLEPGLVVSVVGPALPRPGSGPPEALRSGCVAVAGGPAVEVLSVDDVGARVVRLDNSVSSVDPSPPWRFEFAAVSPR